MIIAAIKVFAFIIIATQSGDDHTIYADEEVFSNSDACEEARMMPDLPDDAQLFSVSPCMPMELQPVPDAHPTATPVKPKQHIPQDDET